MRLARGTGAIASSGRRGLTWAYRDGWGGRGSLRSLGSCWSPAATRSAGRRPDLRVARAILVRHDAVPADGGVDDQVGRLAGGLAACAAGLETVRAPRDAKPEPVMVCT